MGIIEKPVVASEHLASNIQWLLYCMVHNIEKIANYGFA